MTTVDTEIETASELALEPELKLERKPSDTLIKQEDALSLYLQSLLGVSLQPENEVSKNDTAKFHSQTKVEKTPALEKHETIEITVDAEVKTQVKAQIDVKAELKKEPHPIQRPDWPRLEIKYLSARVDGLTLLIPAQCIESIQNVTSRLTPSVKMPVWLYELEDDEDEPIQIVNTKKLIFGGVKSHKILPDSRVYVILLDDGAWGLSCDSIGEVVTLKNSEISWRGKSGKRRWLSGTFAATHSETAFSADSRALSKNGLKKGGIILDIRKIEKVLLG